MDRRPWLVVSVHDVAPTTRAEAEVWLDDLASLGIPATLLVIPGPWSDPALGDDPGFSAWLRQCSIVGHEIAQHGWEHRATGAGPPGRRLIGRALARGCAEFWTLDEGEARDRLVRGRAALADAGVTVRGFVAPGWLASPDAMRALRALGYRYTTSHTAVHDLQGGGRQRAFALSHRPGGALERTGARFMGVAAKRLAAAGRPVRIALHPDDLGRPGLRAETLDALGAVLAAGATARTYIDVVSRQLEGRA